MPLKTEREKEKDKFAQKIKGQEFTRLSPSFSLFFSGPLEREGEINVRLSREMLD